VYHDSGDQIFVMDQVSDHKATEKQWMEALNIKEGLEKLGDREKKILNLRFFVGKTQMEVAEEIGISQAQISRLEKNALMQLRKYMQ
ncbi:MAG: sigma-70 family RNA polymerase sigma factor, partial [Clostridiales bacterium]